MSIALSEFWNRLILAGVTDGEGCKRFASAFGQSHGGAMPPNSTALARFLVKSGQLTSYQARALLEVPQPPIRFGDYLIRGEQTPAPFGRWLEANRIGFDEVGVLFLANLDQIGPTCQSILARHAALAANGLQQFQIQSDDQQLRVFAALPPGRCLAELLAEKPKVSAGLTCRIGVELANALGSLHRHSLIHGAIRPERIWMTEGRNTILLRDPSRTADRPTQIPQAGWLDELDAPWKYAAPEFVNEDQVADVTTDIYSLGCVLFQLVTGRSPINATDWEQAIAKHANLSPPELVETIQRGATGDPLMRVIALAMAKNREERFSTAGELASALTAAYRSVKGTPESSPEAVLKKAAEPINEPPAPVVDSMRTNVSDLPPATTDAPCSKVSISVDRSIVPTQARRRRKRRAPVVLGGLGVIVLLLAAIVALRDPAEPVVPSREAHQIPKVLPAVTSRSPASAVRSGTIAESKNATAPADSAGESAGFTLIDESRLLFAPTFPAGTPPAPLEMLPPGPAVVFSCRIESILNESPARMLYNELSGELDGLRESLEARSGVGIDEISRFSVALHPGEGGRPECSLAVWLKHPQIRSELVRKLNASELRTREGGIIYGNDGDGGGDAYYFANSASNEADVSRMAIGSLARIQEVAELQGAAIALPRSLQSLWNHSSDQADLVALVTPNFLFADGRSLLQASAPGLVPPLKKFLIPNIVGFLFIADGIEDQIYVESRFAPSGGITDAALMRAVGDTIGSWPEWADRFVMQSNLDPSWRLLATRLPLMMRFAEQQIRVDVSRGVVVANGYLPQPAATQIGIATLLAANTPPSAVTSSALPNDSSASLTVAQILDRTMTVSFDQESLEFAVETIVSEFQRGLPPSAKMPRVRIVGGDLQKLGITQNQQVRDFKKIDQPLRRVLTDLVVQANPDKSASGPADPRQSLIWVIAEIHNGDTEILITTRPAASGRYQIPPEFEASEDAR